MATSIMIWWCKADNRHTFVMVQNVHINDAAKHDAHQAGSDLLLACNTLINVQEVAKTRVERVVCVVVEPRRGQLSTITKL